eukprot:350391-Chlamydomonas_euryale.AAC.3
MSTVPWKEVVLRGSHGVRRAIAFPRQHGSAAWRTLVTHRAASGMLLLPKQCRAAGYSHTVQHNWLRPHSSVQLATATQFSATGCSRTAQCTLLQPHDSEQLAAAALLSAARCSRMVRCNWLLPHSFPALLRPI